MSATIYRALQWCKLTPEEITGVIDKIKNGFIYKGEDFYNEVKNLGSWEESTRPDDSVLIWNSDDTGPITIDGNEIGLFVHFDEDTQKFDWACTYKL
jgi:hypothetical protein